MKKIICLFPFFFLFIIQLSCSGNQCAASANFLDDDDSDCVADTADNCLGWFNPDQYDGDDDGVGSTCDNDDTDDLTAGISLIDEPELNLSGHYKIVEDTSLNTSIEGDYALSKTTCTTNIDHLSIGDSVSFNISPDANISQDCLLIYQPDDYMVYCSSPDETCMSLYEK
ncbi:MAG: hypothetical protein HQM16_03810 [Deltaproteobacteria bacterium]|nr:hypothetical protein [Deltaproteobacteria bacterium]